MTQVPRAAASNRNEAQVLLPALPCFRAPAGGQVGALTKHVWGLPADAAFLKSSQGTRMLLIHLSVPRCPASDFIDVG